MRNFAMRNFAMSNEIERTKAVINVLKKDAKGELSKDKPEVPSYVANWFANNACADRDMFEYRLLELARNPQSGPGLDDILFSTWLLTLGFDDTIETLVKMYANGYISDEPKYTVKMKALPEDFNYLNYRNDANVFVFSTDKATTFFKTKFTRKELEEAGLAEVFNSPLFEVEKVK